MRRRFPVCVGLGLILRALLAPAAEPVKSDRGDAVVEMPAFVITETKSSERPWRYAAAEGFEIISQVSDQSAQQVFAALWRGPRLTLPPELRPSMSTPTAVIIFDQEPDHGGIGSMGAVRGTNEQSSHWTNVIKRTQADREIFSVNLFGRFFSYSSTFRFDLRTHLALHTPAAPPWLFEALYGAYGLYREGIDYPEGGNATGVVRAIWCNEAEYFRADPLLGPANEHFYAAMEKRRDRPVAPSPLLAAVPPLASLWSGGYPEDRRAPADTARWAATCALFARWALYSEEGKRHDAFWRFAVQACGRVVDEAFFEECFGLNFEQARGELAWYLPIALGEPAQRRIAPLVVPAITFRPATRSEVARVRGDFERGEAVQLAKTFPEIATKYSAKAGRTLRAAHLADPTDARLTEVLGLYEFESGDSAPALELLTAATATGQARPRAWFTLAHLRFLATNPPGAARGARPPMLTHAEALPILMPLEASWRLAPPLAASYELLAELWRRCPDLPAERIVGYLREGQRQFPRNTRLALATFRACLERGERNAAREMLEAALPFTSDPAMRQRLEQARAAMARER